MPVTQTGPLSQVNMAVVRPCAATFIELVKKVSFVNELWTLEDHFLRKVEIDPIVVGFHSEPPSHWLGNAARSNI